MDFSFFIILLFVCTLDATTSGLLLKVKSFRGFMEGPLVLTELPSMQETTIDSEYCTSARFSPSGKQVIYIKKNMIWLAESSGKRCLNIRCNSQYYPALNWVSLQQGEYIYWTEGTKDIYRYRLGNDSIETIYSGENKLFLLSVSADGSRAACSKEAWSAWGIDLINGKELWYGEGCQATVSPSGKFIAHNLPGHYQMVIYLWGVPDACYKKIHAPQSYMFNKHRFSSQSDDYITFFASNNIIDANPMAYLYNMATDELIACGEGDPWDFFPNASSLYIGPNAEACSADTLYYYDNEPVYRLIYPNGGEILQAADTVWIRWETVNTVTDAILLFSSDLGKSWDVINQGHYIKSNEPHWGNYPWIVPSIQSNSCLIRIKKYLGGKFDQTDAPFSINNDTNASNTVFRHLRKTSSTSNCNIYNLLGKKQLKKTSGVSIKIASKTEIKFFINPD